MRIFVTGASGHIGSAVVTELVLGGHEVMGLARSDTSATIVEGLGATVFRGGLDDPDGLSKAADRSDAVIHLAFDHELAFGSRDFAGAAAKDVTAVTALCDALIGTGKVFIGVGIGRTGDPTRDAAVAASPRAAAAHTIESYQGREVRTVLVAIPPVTHSNQDRAGFVPQLIEIARKTGISAYVGEGANRWPAGHTLDVAHLYRLALKKAPAGSQLYAATEEGVPVRDIAEAIGRGLAIPVRGLSPDQAAEHFATFPFIGLDITMPAGQTRRLLDWAPAHPGLVADLEEGHYFAR
jgi:nucleoside-diphosphate-sugar epimerase